MELLSSAGLLHKDRIRTPFSRWVDDLHHTCGSFRPRAMDTSLDIRGEARRINACGMEFSHISNDLDRVDHDWDDVRRDAIEHLKKESKDSKISEDELEHGEKEVQKLTDQYIAKIEAHLAHKEKEIMTV